MVTDYLPLLLGMFSGILVGFTLGLVGGGGSILAVPLLVYLVGVDQPHIAIGTAAVAVAVNALIGLGNHARAGTVRWPCGLTFAGAGAVGALAGSTLGKMVDGQQLLALFAVLMLVIAAQMLRGRNAHENEAVRMNKDNAPRLIGYGLGTGTLSGFFGIGGGFLIVPGLKAATSMPMVNAVGTSLVAVAAFGLTTSISYAFSGLVHWMLALAFVVGGLIGSPIGLRASQRIARKKGLLNSLFAGLVVAVALYMLVNTAGALRL